MSTIVVVTFSGVAKVGGIVMGGRTDCNGADTKVSRTRLVSKEDLPTPSSPHMQIRTDMLLIRAKMLIKSSQYIDQTVGSLSRCYALVTFDMLDLSMSSMSSMSSSGSFIVRSISSFRPRERAKYRG